MTATRLEKTTRTITWTESCEIRVGYHTCAVCGVETPEPTMDQMINFARERAQARGGFMWPWENYEPVGWEEDPELGGICPDCVAAKKAAFSARRAKK